MYTKLLLFYGLKKEKSTFEKNKPKGHSTVIQILQSRKLGETTAKKKEQNVNASTDMNKLPYILRNLQQKVS